MDPKINQEEEETTNVESNHNYDVLSRLGVGGTDKHYQEICEDNGGD